MGRLKFLLVIFFLMGCSPTPAAISVTAPTQTDKKLIEYGWDVPTVSFIREHIEAMQQRPFDGVAYKLTGDDVHPSSAFDSRPWTEAELQLDTLAQIEWGRFNSNFIVLWASNPVTMNWFDDQRWEAITANMRLFSKALKVSKAIGVFFDPEFYAVRETHSLWLYTSEIYPTLNQAEVEVQVRKRGAQFMTALQSEVDRIDFLSFYFLSEVVRRSESSGEANAYTHFDLLPAFIYGMLETAKPDIRFIDGNEPSYYFTSPEQYPAARELIATKTTFFVAAELRPRYQQQVRIANALYLDYLMALRPEHDRGLPWEDRLRWLEHNIYYSLQQSDAYVWLYSEHADWWNNDVSPDIEAAIIRAREKITKNEALGFEITIPP
ncbi:MAG: hypothetical protein IT321_16880 [Anaerolineae bacterium]|nr:hypothetical protein [Anaerolineae bacterium]